MKLDKDYAIEKALLLAAFVKRFRFIIVFAIFSMMYGYIILQVNAINSSVPDDSLISEKTTAAPRTKIDSSLAESITSLEEENIDIKTIFNEARKNPFSE